MAANPSTERHLYSYPLPTQSELDFLRKAAGLAPPQALTKKTEPGYYSIEFSPECSFYVQNYHGPQVPTTEIIKVSVPSKFSFIRLILVPIWRA